MASIHMKNLADLCCVCGERLQKSTKAVTSKFLCMKWKDFLAEKFEILVEKDLEEIHPQYFCHSCYVHPDRRTLVKATWLTHYEDNCGVCSRVEEIKKGGRPKKPKRGRKADSRPSNTQETKDANETSLQDLEELTKDLPSLRFKEFSDKFSFPENMKRDLICPVCLQVLDKPVETTCQHYFCVECLKGLIKSSQGGTCAVCKEKVGPVKIPTRMALKLIAEQEIICKKCGQTVHYEHRSSHVCSNDTEPVAEQPPAMAAPVDPTQTLQQVLKDAQAGNFSPEVEKICTAYVRSRVKNAPDGKTVLFKTGGKVTLCFEFVL